MSFSGLMVFNVDVQNGFSLRGKVAHEPGEGAGLFDLRSAPWFSASRRPAGDRETRA